MMSNKRRDIIGSMTAEWQKNTHLSVPVSPEQRKARMRAAGSFLDLLVEKIRSGALVDADQIPVFYRTFQQEHAGLGDFGLIHALGLAWQRDLNNECISESDPNQLPPDAIELVVALGLLEQVVFAPHSQ